ncbi:MAG: RsmB/NOP family class I SAM-dependent RNA methyltransferase [Paracoccaceae bacterium]|nr:RsmB/NOP family class I SAM-dependent RNA methyltransferase [Paracoccaceae bacterium]
MTPNARLAAAIEILDSLDTGGSAEQALTTWARRNRYAGSSDRAAVRDIVFDAIRRRRSDGWLGGGTDGRALIVGRLMRLEQSVEDAFTGERFAPAPLTAAERARVAVTPAVEAPVRLDCPDWLWEPLTARYGANTEAILSALQMRAPFFLRANTARVTREGAIERLTEEGISVAAHELADTAIEVREHSRRVRQTRVYQDGLIEPQDAASQAAVALALQQMDGARVLDFCAGGGGKSLAFAAEGKTVAAYDANPGRMADLGPRAARAGVTIETLEAPRGSYDMVFCDAPCSGSGAWRRQPEAKWALTPSRLRELNATQDAILRHAKDFVRPGGVLAYATCSLLAEENDSRTTAFFSEFSDWKQLAERQWTPLNGGDGFYLAVLGKP